MLFDRSSGTEKDTGRVADARLDNGVSHLSGPDVVELAANDM